MCLPWPQVLRLAGVCSSNPLGEAGRFTASRPTPENGRMALISPSPPEMWKGVPGSGWKDPRQAGCQNRGGSVNEC